MDIYNTTIPYPVEELHVKARFNPVLAPFADGRPVWLTSNALVPLMRVAEAVFDPLPYEHPPSRDIMYLS